MVGETMASRDSEPEDDPRSGPGRRAFYGRRQGRRLRPGLKALLDETLPKIAGSCPRRRPARPQRPCSTIRARASPGDRLRRRRAPGLAGRTASRNRLFGRGILRQRGGRAVAPDPGPRPRQRPNPTMAMPAICSMRCPAAAWTGLFILFPDPWPKTRHHKRRIVQDQTLARLAEVMKDGVELRLATDDMDYLRWMLERLLRSPDFEWLARGPRDWRERPEDWPLTRYEIKAVDQGRRPVYLRFRRRPRGASKRQNRAPRPGLEARSSWRVEKPCEARRSGARLRRP